MTFGQLSNAALLWIEFSNFICDDLDHQLQQIFPNNDIYSNDNDELFHQGSAALDYGLYLIDVKLRDQGHSLEEYNMPEFEHNWYDALRRSSAIQSSNALINEQRSYNVDNEAAIYQSRYAIFNQDQKAAFDCIVQEIESNDTGNSNCFFLHGPAGTGKTFVYNTIGSYLRSQNKIVLCVASSGIAALLLTGGRTSHSRLKIPLSIDESSTCYIPRNSALAELIRNTALIIWDEVPLQHKHCFEAVDRTLKDICENDLLFGGIPVILGGDFAQIAPVIRYGDRTAIVNASIRQSYIWRQTEVVYLRINMRISGSSANDMHFKNWLNSITYTPQHQNALITLPEYINRTSSIEGLISKVYPPSFLAAAIQQPQLLYKTAILTTRNDTMDELNNLILNAMPGHATVLCSADVVEENNSEDNEVYQVTSEYLQTLNPSNLPPARLSIKVGCIVMLIRNMNPKAGLCNGTRLVVKEIGQYVLKVLVLKDVDDGVEQIEFIPRITLLSQDEQYPFILRRIQFPVKLSFAMTINKSQGQSLQTVGIDLRNPVFTHGQLYVALSRSTKVENIHVLQSDSTSNTVENIVYPELLL